MKKLFKVAAVSAFTLMSVNAFAASQQAEELKKFQAWEGVTGDKITNDFMVVTNATATSEAAASEAAVAEFDKKMAEYVAELDALGIKSEDISPLVAKYKEFVDAEKVVVQAFLAQAKSPSADNANKVTETTAKANELNSEVDKLADQLEDKFPADE